MSAIASTRHGLAGCQAKAIEQLAAWFGVSGDNPHGVVDALLEHNAQASCMTGGALIISSGPAAPTGIPASRSFPLFVIDFGVWAGRGVFFEGVGVLPKPGGVAGQRVGA